MSSYRSGRLFFLFIMMISLIITDGIFSAITAFPRPSKYGVVTSTANEYASKGRFSLDENRILVIDYGTAYNSLGKWHNPFFIARYAHTLYNDWYNTNCTDELLKNDFLLQANYLVLSYKEKHNGMAYWEYPFENTYFDVPPGWISGIGQSHIAGVLLRAHHITGDNVFENIARKAVEVYLHPMSSGGVITDDEKGLWIQEVASPEIKKFYILNGHISGLLGLFDVAELTSDKELFDVVRRGMLAVRSHLSEFDAGFSSFYSLEVKSGGRPEVAPRGDYNAIHVWQLNVLYDITKDPAYSDMATLFNKYEKIEDVRIAKGSSNPQTHGPSEAAGWYGNRYWSHNTFPTYYEVHMTSDEPLDGIFIAAYYLKAAPRSFSVSLLQNKQWHQIWTIQDNTQTEIFLEFDHPVIVSGIRLDINSDNGNNNVALNAVMPIRSLKKTTGDYTMPIVSLSTLKPGFRKNAPIVK